MRVMMVLAALSAAVCVQAKGGVDIRRNQVGYSPLQEKVIVVEGVNPSGKLRVVTPEDARSSQLRCVKLCRRGRARYAMW